MVRILFILAFLFSAGEINAQRFNAFAAGGIVASQVSGDNLGGFDKAGVSVGLGVSTPLAKRLSMSMEIRYVQKGSRRPSKLDQGDPRQYLLRLNYLEVPVMVSYRINERFDAGAGFTAGYLLSSYEENENGELIFNDPFEKTEIGVAGSVGYMITEQLKLQLRGLQSLLAVRETDWLNNRIVYGQFNSAFELMASWYFRKAK
jgi:hypothetical protein